MNATGQGRGNKEEYAKENLICGLELRLLKRYKNVGMLFAISSKSLSSTGTIAVGCHRCPQTL